MSDPVIPPFYFPTTVFLIDDSADFLANASLMLDAQLAFRLFQSPADALAAINLGSPAAPTVQSLFALYKARDEEDDSRHVIDLQLSMIHREVHNERRFAHVSVVVVDHDMPGMNGLEFCRAIRDSRVKKILLTGKADERVAVEAFNRGVIDCYIRKQEDSVMLRVNEAVADMQARYFRELERMLSDALMVGTPRFLGDAGFARAFSAIRERLGIVEHYLTCQPDGMLMLDARGGAYLLVVANDERLRAEHDIAFDQAAPESLLAALRSGRFVPYFWRQRGVYSPDCEPWGDYLHPASVCQGQETYYYTVVRQPAGFNLGYVSSYVNYLDSLDEAGRQHFIALPD